jgi:hypothetical protein
MGHFAKLDDQNVVTDVIVVNNETLNNLPFPSSELVGLEFLKGLYGDGITWKQTSYNGSFRKNFAGIGYFYDVNIDAFIAPKPCPSWLLNTETGQWQAPVPYPTDGKVYSWNEETQQWVEFAGE